MYSKEALLQLQRASSGVKVLNETDSRAETASAIPDQYAIAEARLARQKKRQQKSFIPLDAAVERADAPVEVAGRLFGVAHDDDASKGAVIREDDDDEVADIVQIGREKNTSYAKHVVEHVVDDLESAQTQSFPPSRPEMTLEEVLSSISDRLHGLKENLEGNVPTLSRFCSNF
jgi:hypothetical protein